MTNMTMPPTNDDEDDAGDDESLMELKTGRICRIICGKRGAEGPPKKMTHRHTMKSKGDLVEVVGHEAITPTIISSSIITTSARH